MGFWTRFHTTSPFTTPWHLAQSLVAYYGLTPGIDCSLDVQSKYGTISLNVEAPGLPVKTRQMLKRHFDFVIPGWQENYRVKSAIAQETLHLPNQVVELNITLGSVMVCTPVGTKLEPPSHFAVEQASELLTMTAEQALEYVRSKANELIKPREVQLYDCSLTPETEEDQPQ